MDYVEFHTQMTLLKMQRTKLKKSLKTQKISQEDFIAFFQDNLRKESHLKADWYKIKLASMMECCYEINKEIDGNA